MPTSTAPGRFGVPGPFDVLALSRQEFRAEGQRVRRGRLLAPGSEDAEPGGGISPPDV